jgi:hypothetical protein
MGAVNINNTGSGASVALSSDGTSLLLNGTAIGGGSSTLVFNNQTAAYTVVSGDAGKIINCSGASSFTVSLTAAATLGSGFNCVIWNTSTTAAMAVTIDPNGAETIDGKTTLILRRGEGMQIVCDGTNWQTGNKKTMRGYAENIPTTYSRASAAGSGGTAVGSQSSAVGQDSIAVGYTCTATGTGSMAGGYAASAGSDYSLALGGGSGGYIATTATGAGAIALGNSYASGTDSFSVHVQANGTSTYGALNANGVVLGYQAKTTDVYGVALGAQAQAGNYACAIGQGALAQGRGSFAFGYGAKAVERNKFAYAGPWYNAVGDRQGGLLILAAATTDATATVLVSDTGAAGTTNQLILPNNTAFAFTGVVVARQKAANGTASAAWKVEGLIRREANAGTTTLVASTVTVISNVPAWTLALSADTTNGGLAVTGTGAAATNIFWAANIQTVETTYA